MSRPKTYVVTLTDAQRAHVLAFLKKGAAKARMLTRARILLCSAEGKTDRLIADLLQVTPETVRNIRKRCATAGLEAALQERPRPGAQPNLDSTPEALRVALACSAPPEGREHWTMHLLADRLVELEVAESISDETVRRVVNQTNASPGRSGSGASDRARLRFSGGWTMGATAPPNPPIPSARSSAWTNDRIQLLADGRESLPMEPGQPQRVDDAYQRHGACNLLLFFQPRRGWRAVHATERRTNDDVARQMQWLVDAAFPAAEGSRVVLDNRNTHTPASL
jgi:transposase